MAVNFGAFLMIKTRECDDFVNILIYNVISNKQSTEMNVIVPADFKFIFT